MRNKILYRPAIKKATNNVEINDEVVDTDDFDFTELDQDQIDPEIVKKPDISDDFDFDFDDLDTVKEITPKPTNDVDPSSDFDFEEPDVKPETNLETPINDFNFDFDDDDVLVTTAPKKPLKML